MNRYFPTEDRNGRKAQEEMLTVIIREDELLKHSVMLSHTHEHGYNKKRQTVTSMGKDMEKLEPSSHAASGNVIKSCCCFGNQSSRSSNH